MNDQASSKSPESANPVLVTASRGGAVESRHRGAAALVGADGTVVAAFGDIERPVFPRSALKPLQALPLLETGAADALDLGDRELALACASHNGSAVHLSAVRGWLDRLGLSDGDLICGAQPPSDPQESARLAGGGEQPCRAHNNCSGKHCGFLSVARELGAPAAGYHDHTHPAQQRALGAIESMAGMELDGQARGIDGCGLPAYSLPLGNLALAMARMANPDSLPEARAAAVARLGKAIAAAPEMIAGPGRVATEIIRATRGRVLAKSGAEGVFVAVLRDFGYGLAVKIDDGAARAAEVAIIEMIDRAGALDADARAALAPLARPVLANWAGDAAGSLEPAADW